MSDTPPIPLSDYCSFENVYRQTLVPFFNRLDDTRSYNQSYALADCLKAGFSLYSLKAPSMLQFRQLARVEEHNLTTIYDVGVLPEDTAFREILDGVNPEDLRDGFVELYKHFMGCSQLRQRYQCWENYTAVSADGVEHFCSKKVSCKHCLTRNHRDGSTTNYHSMLSAAIVHPDYPEVLPIDHEPIVKTDGTVKNDCERNAVHRLLNHFQSAYSELDTIFLFDALYNCAPVVKRLEQVENWRYLIGVKENGSQFLFDQFDVYEDDGRVDWISTKDDKNNILKIGFANGLSLNKSNTEHKVNMLYVIKTDKKGKETHFTYISNIVFTAKNAPQLARVARCRWKIENETFNTLKNQGYHFKHNFGHGKEALCTVLSYLMMMAFWVDQIQQAANDLFKKILKGLKTKISLWNNMKAVVKIVPLKSMEELYIKVAEMFCIRLI